MGLGLTISFQTDDGASASENAGELREFIREEAPGAKVDRTRDDREAQDVGAVLTVVLGSSAVLALANGIYRWLELRTKSKVTVSGPGGTLTADRLTCKDAADLAARLAPIVAPPATGTTPEKVR